MCRESRRIPARVLDGAHRATPVELLAGRFPNLEYLELIAADLCRPELLIELEGAVEVDLAAGHCLDVLGAVP